MGQYDNKYIREQKEMKSLFNDKRFSRQAWQAVGQAMLRNPAHKPVTILDKDNNETTQSRLERYNYEQLSQDVKNLLKEDREPTELEMILGGQIMKARYDTSAAIFVRDTLGAKPVDESKTMQIDNPYEDLSDEELELLAKHRETKHKGDTNNG